MSFEKILLIGAAAGGLALLLAILIVAVRALRGAASGAAARAQLEAKVSGARDEVMRATQDAVRNIGDMALKTQRDSAASGEKLLGEKFQTLNARFDGFSTLQSESARQTESRISAFGAEMRDSLKEIRETMEKRVDSMRQDNNKRLDEMRVVVDEKLQKTLNERMTESFKLVNDRLGEVYRALGEMQTLAQGVGDLKKVLSNVKSRGVLGEVQLGAILEDILTPDQYELNVATKKGSANRVEFAIKLPAEDGSFVYLPIDAKFPGDTYANLRDAYEKSDRDQIDARVKMLLTTVTAEAKDIASKYIDPPNTTDFAIMFLPFEGLYAEVVNRGMVEKLQHDFRVNIAGPSTMAALINSLQMSFRTIAIQRRSDEVWHVLSAVSTEFDKFADALARTQQHMTQATDDLDKLVGTRTRAIQRKLKNVARLPEDQAPTLLDEAPEEEPASDAAPDRRL